MKKALSGTYGGKTYWLAVGCYPKTAEIKVMLMPDDGLDPLTITQNLGQAMPPYQAFLSDGLLGPGKESFMVFMEENGLGHIADYKRFDADVYTGRLRRTAAIFQFDKTALALLDPEGCAQFERRFDKLTRRMEKRRTMAGTASA